MYIISVSNAKGGVGKTSTVINTASILADKGYAVLVVDTDPQGDSTTFFVDDPQGTNDISDVLLHDIDINSIIVPSNFPNLDIALNYCKADQSKLKINDFVDREQTLKNKLCLLHKKYDFIMIDCPPALDSFTQNALVASTHVIVPIKADSSAYIAISRIFKKVYNIKEIYNSQLEILGILAVEKENLRVYKESIKSLRDQLGEFVFNTEIRRSKDVPESSYAGKPLITYAPYSNPTYDYKRLVKEIEKKLNFKKEGLILHHG